MKPRWQILSGLLLGLCLAVAAPPQEKKQSPLRTVRGVVVDKQENPVRDAVVYLKNEKTLSVKTYTANEVGEYRFGGLDPNVDYEIHAEHSKEASAKRSISSFDNRKEIVINLKLDKKKESK